MKNIEKVLSLIQCRLRAPKDQFNKFGKYHYRCLEGIQEALKPLLAEHQAIVTLNDEIIPVSDRIYVKSTATITAEGESISTSAYAREASDKKGMDEAQITGAASSYARKYAMNGLFAIDDVKDPDANSVPNNRAENIIDMQQKRRTNETLPVNPNSSEKTTNSDSQAPEAENANQTAAGTNNQATISGAQRTAITRLASQKNVTESQLKQVLQSDFKKASIDELSASEASVIINRLKKRA